VAPDEDLAGSRVLKPGDEPESGRFSASGGAYKDHELLVVDVEIDVIYGNYPSGKDFCDLFQADLRHITLLLLIYEI